MKATLNQKHYFYLLLSIVGGGYTYYYIILGVIAHKGNFDTLEFISSTWVDSFYAKSLTLDFWTGAISGTSFMLFEGIRLKMKRLWLYLFLTFFIAFAFAFPLFLFMRESYLKNLK
jgi:Terpene cyclase DEP1